MDAEYWSQYTKTESVDRSPSSEANSKSKLDSVQSESYVTFSSELTVLRWGAVSPRETPKLENHPLSAGHECTFREFATAPHIWRSLHYPHPENATGSGSQRTHLTSGVDSSSDNVSHLYSGDPELKSRSGVYIIDSSFFTNDPTIRCWSECVCVCARTRERKLLTASASLNKLYIKKRTPVSLCNTEQLQSHPRS
jgi:hypothetical protein